MRSIDRVPGDTSAAGDSYSRKRVQRSRDCCLRLFGYDILLIDRPGAPNRDSLEFPTIKVAPCAILDRILGTPIVSGTEIEPRFPIPLMGMRAAVAGGGENALRQRAQFER